MRADNRTPTSPLDTVPNVLQTKKTRRSLWTRQSAHEHDLAVHLRTLAHMEGKAQRSAVQQDL